MNIKSGSKWVAVVASVLCFYMATAASAEEGTGPCAEDAARLCKDVKPGERRMAKCMKEHSSELSAACKDNMGKAKEKVREAAQSCKADVSKFCADVKRGGGRIVQCLKQHEADLSPACKDEMTKPGGRK